jgi:3'(2'), 5'-bisphosphate nucleotidase
LNTYLERLGPHEIKPMGSSLKICLVADGQADVYPRFGPTSEWDTAAAQAILESAGGSMIDLAGRTLRYNTKESLLNPHFLAIGDCNRDWLAAVPK